MVKKGYNYTKCQSPSFFLTLGINDVNQSIVYLNMYCPGAQG